MFKFLLFVVILCVTVEVIRVSACLPSGKHNHVTIGSDTYLCVTLTPLIWNTTGEYLQISLKVQADQLSSIKVPQSWTSNHYKNDTTMQRLSIMDQYQAGAGLGVSVSSMGILSYQRVYRQVLKYALPTSPPTQMPSTAPTVSPTQDPTESPSSVSPSLSPTMEPTTVQPTLEPTTAVPTISLAPSESPTLTPTALPSTEPSYRPTAIPTTATPSVEPSLLPTVVPTNTQPTQSPTLEPSLIPTTIIPSVEPSQIPSVGARRALRSAKEEYAVRFGLNEAPTSPPTTNGTANSTSNGTSTTVDNGLYGTKSVTFPMLMAIISVDKGKVKSVVWDDFCNWCTSSHCASNTVDYNNNEVSAEGHNCYVSDDSCLLSPEPVAGTNVTSSSTNLCELNVYVTWYGTDSTGAHFQSAASRFSRLSIDQMKNVTGAFQDQRATY